MDPKLRSMLVVAGVVVLGGGVGFMLSTPQPATRSMAELRDAGVGDGQSVVLVCPERITPQTRRRINRVQPGFLRPKQVYARVGRVAKCFTQDGGNCFTPATMLARVADLQGEVVVPSLRRDLAGVDLDAGLTDDGGTAESDDVDDSFQYRMDDCRVERCSTYDAGVDWPNNVCGNLNRLWAEVPPCVIPDCYTRPDGGWDDTAVVDCLRTQDVPGGGQVTRWAGCNVMPTSASSGTQCLPVECSVVAGDNPIDVLRGGR